jgi:hypothetical protein
MSNSVSFRRQLEALLMIPPAQTAPSGRASAPASCLVGERPNAPAPEPPQQTTPDPAPAAPAPIATPSFLKAAPSTAVSEFAVAETLQADSLPIPRDPLPFVDASEVPSAAPTPARRDLPAERHPSGTIETASLPIPREVLPFGITTGDPSSTALLTELPIPRDPLPFDRVTEQRPADPAVTGPLPTPLGATGEPTIEGLTLDAYAALCAELAARPTDADAIFAAHGLADPRKRHAVDAAWRAHLAHDSAAYARWQDRYRWHAQRAR